MNKKNSKKLVLITQSFPFYPGEQFLESEIEYLCKEFDVVHIIPISVPNNGSSPRDIPDNAVVHPMFLSSSKYGKAVNRARNLMFDTQGLRYFLKELPTARKKGAKAVLALANWISMSVPIRKNIKKLVETQLDNDNNAVFYSYWLSTPALALAMYKETNSNIFAISRAHGGDLYEYRHKPEYLPLQRKIVGALDGIFFISEDGRKYLLNKAPEMSGRFHVSRLGTFGVHERTQVSTDDVFRILTCSYMRPVKRLGLLADALKYCKGKIEWHHIGDGPERAKVEAKTSEFPDNIKFIFHGNFTNEEIKSYYQKNPVDVFVNVSESEGIPVSIMEAYSSGIPAIATNVGGTSEIVLDDNGVLVDKNITARELANVIDEFVNLDAAKRMEMSERAYQTWDSYYNADKNYTDFAVKIKNFGEKVQYD